jgi:serine/threonine protein kinase
LRQRTTILDSAGGQRRHVGHIAEKYDGTVLDAVAKVESDIAEASTRKIPSDREDFASHVGKVAEFLVANPGIDGVPKQALRAALHALHYLHEEKGHFHRDLKWDNILIRGSETEADLVLGDLGSCTACDSPERLLETNKSTFPPPETQADRTKWGAKSDIWALGLMVIQLYHLCPLPAGSAELARWHSDFLTNRLDPIKKAMPDIGDFLEKCLAKDPSKRPAAHDLLGAPLLA